MDPEKYPDTGEHDRRQVRRDPLGAVGDLRVPGERRDAPRQRDDRARADAADRLQGASPTSSRSWWSRRACGSRASTSRASPQQWKKTGRVDRRPRALAGHDPLVENLNKTLDALRSSIGQPRHPGRLERHRSSRRRSLQAKAALESLQRGGPVGPRLHQRPAELRRRRRPAPWSGSPTRPSPSSSWPISSSATPTPSSRGARSRNKNASRHDNHPILLPAAAALRWIILGLAGALAGCNVVPPAAGRPDALLRPFGSRRPAAPAPAPAPCGSALRDGRLESYLNQREMVVRDGRERGRVPRLPALGRAARRGDRPGPPLRPPEPPGRWPRSAPSRFRSTRSATTTWRSTSAGARGPRTGSGSYVASFWPRWSRSRPRGRTRRSVARRALHRPRRGHGTAGTSTGWPPAQRATSPPSGAGDLGRASPRRTELSRRAAAIRSSACSTFSRLLKALIRTWPSPHLPKPAPGRADHLGLLEQEVEERPGVAADVDPDVGGVVAPDAL